MIDVIVPVYNAYEDLVRCVERVRKHTPEPHRLVLIDDCSPDVRVGAFFDQLALERGQSLDLLRNPANMGFVATVNRAMALSRHDVVLLNSDTLVTPGWLGKLIRCAASDPMIGTITPFSNNAEICSFPEFCKNNEVTDPDAVAAAMTKLNRPIYPDIPTAVGFCMYIKRVVLAEIGLFDQETFGLGYGEENDFSMRARQAGYRNVLCDDAFVAHLGGRSFDQKTQALKERNAALLLEKHPEYLQLVMDFIRDDPLQGIRTRILTQMESEKANWLVSVFRRLGGVILGRLG